MLTVNGWVHEPVDWKEDKKIPLVLSPDSIRTAFNVINQYKTDHVSCGKNGNDTVLYISSTLPIVRKMNRNIIEYINEKNSINGVELTIKIKPQKYNIKEKTGLKFTLESIDTRFPV